MTAARSCVSTAEFVEASQCGASYFRRASLFALRERGESAINRRSFDARRLASSVVPGAAEPGRAVRAAVWMLSADACDSV